jgi:hypothetical protein
LAMLPRNTDLPPSFPMPANQVVATNLGGSSGAAKAPAPLPDRQEMKAGAAPVAREGTEPSGQSSTAEPKPAGPQP